MKQRNVFLETEGDAWFERNVKTLADRRLPEQDLLLTTAIPILNAFSKPIDVLEIGCSDGTRLAWIQENYSARCFGVDPSSKAVAKAIDRGINAHQATADHLPFSDRSFDLVIFGFCLYLCDDEDLPKIASEADRVLRAPGWLMIFDFYAEEIKKIPYRHATGVMSRKMDYRTLFQGNPSYHCLHHTVRHHETGDYTDDANEWVSVSVLRKNEPNP